jgi:histidinol-phosphate aminotransferase
MKYQRALPVASQLLFNELMTRQLLQRKGWTDLSSNIDSLGMRNHLYPDLDHSSLKKLYLKFLVSIKNLTPPRQPRLDQILFTRGSTEGIDLLVRAWSLRRGAKVIIAAPTFPLYEISSQISQLKPTKVLLSGPNYNQLDLKTLRTSRGALVFLCSPNNPTGSPIEMINGTLEDLLEIPGITVVIDEAYQEFSREVSSLRLLKKYNNLVVLRTFSKALGSAGLRVGAVFGSTQLIEILRQIQGPFSMTQKSFEEAKRLFSRPQTIHRRIQRLLRQRDRFVQQMNDLSCVRKVFPSQTNFLLVQFHRHSWAIKRLKRGHFIVQDCSSVVADSVRISLGAPTDMRRLLSTLQSSSDSE